MLAIKDIGGEEQCNDTLSIIGTPRSVQDGASTLGSDVDADGWPLIFQRTLSNTERQTPQRKRTSETTPTSSSSFDKPLLIQICSPSPAQTPKKHSPTPMLSHDADGFPIFSDEDIVCLFT